MQAPKLWGINRVYLKSYLLWLCYYCINFWSQNSIFSEILLTVLTSLFFAFLLISFSSISMSCGWPCLSFFANLVGPMWRLCEDYVKTMWRRMSFTKGLLLNKSLFQIVFLLFINNNTGCSLHYLSSNFDNWTEQDINTVLYSKARLF